MREILFRGKRTDNGEWVEGIPIKTHISTFIVFEENPHFCNQYGYMEIDGLCLVISETVGQFTGLKDKYGKKIFEGDIVKFDGRYYEVRYEMGQFCFGINMPIAYKRFEIEVIGNIHDKPVLLKGGEK